MPPNRTITYEGAELYPKQRAAIYDPARIVCIEASAKSGKTVGSLAWFIEIGLRGKAGQNYWWVAPVYTQAEIAFRRCWGYLLPIRPMCNRNQSAFLITLPNKARLVFKSGDRPDDLYGEDVYGAVLDEASRMREESWHAIRSTLTYTKGPARLIGNVRGRKNWFYRLSRLAESGEEQDMSYHRITAWEAVEAGVLDRAEIESAKRDFTRLGQEDVFRQLYMAEAIDDASNPFGIEAIKACFRDGYSKEYAAAAGVDLAGRGAVNITRSGDAESRDWTAVVILDKNGDATYVDRWRKSHRDTMLKVVAKVGRTKVLIDSTGTGDALVEELQRRGDMRVLGYTFTERSRQDLLEGLVLAIQEQRIHFPDRYTSDGRGSLREELESFEFRYTARGVRYTVPEGVNDDLVMALALAVKRMPWKRKVKTSPEGLAQVGGSKWTSEETGDDFAWRRYQEGKKPTLSPEQKEAPQTLAVPVMTQLGASSRWTDAG